MARKIPVKPFVRKPWDDGETVEFEGQTGVVWSAGPIPASAWVALDGDTSRMVAVKKPSANRPAMRLPLGALPRMTQEWLRRQVEEVAA